MCGCEDTFVCSRCAGDPKQDWRLEWENDPSDDQDDAHRQTERDALTELRGAA